MIVIQSLAAYYYVKVATELKVGKALEYCFWVVKMILLSFELRVNFKLNLVGWSLYVFFFRQLFFPPNLSLCHSRRRSEPHRQHS